MLGKTEDRNTLQNREDPLGDNFPDEENAEHDPEDFETESSFSLIAVECFDQSNDGDIDWPQHPSLQLTLAFILGH